MATLLKNEEMINELRFKGFGTKPGRDSVLLTTKRIIINTVSKGATFKKTEKHIDLDTVAGVSISNERHFNWKAFAIMMIFPIAGIVAAYFFEMYLNYAIGAFVGLLVLGVLVFRKSYHGIYFMLKGVVNYGNEPTGLEISGNAYRANKKHIDVFVFDVMQKIIG